MSALLDEVLKFDPKQPRVPKGSPHGGRWIKGGAAPWIGAGHLLHERLAKDGGFTYQPVLAISPTKGYALSISRENERVFEGDVTEEQIAEYIGERAPLFKADPQAHVGGWLDAETGKVYLDVSIISSDREAAVTLAQQHGQEGIYDLEKGETIIVKRPEERRKEEAGALRLSSGGDPEGDRGRHQQAAPRALEEVLKYSPNQARHPAGTPWASAGPGPGRFASGSGTPSGGSGLWETVAEQWKGASIPESDLEDSGVFEFLRSNGAIAARAAPVPEGVFQSMKAGLAKFNLPERLMQEVKGLAYVETFPPYGCGATAMFDMQSKHLVLTSDVHFHDEEVFHQAVAHELGHALDFMAVPHRTVQDLTNNGGEAMSVLWARHAISAAPEFKIEISPEDDAYITGVQQAHTDKRSGMTTAQFADFFKDAYGRIVKGDIAMEAVNAVHAGITAKGGKKLTAKQEFGLTLRYPLVKHFMAYENLRGQFESRTCGEIFAQLHSFYYTSRAKMKRALPKAYAYFHALDQKTRGETDEHVRKAATPEPRPAASVGLSGSLWQRAFGGLPGLFRMAAKADSGPEGQQADSAVRHHERAARDAVGMNGWQLALKFTEANIARHPKGTPWAASGPGPGRFKAKGKGSAGGGLEGYSDRAKLVKGTIVTDNVDDAARALFENRKVQLDSARKVSVLLDKLNAMVKEAISKGEKAGLYNLCNVTVPGTSLFCAESKGIPRVEMPQLKGEPIKGSAADKLPRDSRGEVDLSAGFRAHLEKLGFKITDEVEKAAYMKASQNELNGAKVAGIAQAIRENKLADERLFVSQDNYIVDGHHRWAAMVGVDSDDGHLGDLTLPVARVEVGIIELLALANTYATEQGIPQMSAGDKAKKGEKGCGCGTKKPVLRDNLGRPISKEDHARQLMLALDGPSLTSLL